MATDAELGRRLTEVAADVELALERLLPGGASCVDGPAPRLAAAMRYATLGGGKRLRAFLIVAGAELFGADPARALRVAAAIEMVHAYSLIHDDLPAMDDAQTRRGQAACHVRFDEATAILAGDALLTLAIEVLADPATDPRPEIRSELILALTRAAGAHGMCAGQMLDLEAEHRPLGLDEVSRLEHLKTGDLMGFCAEAGAIAARAPADVRAALRSYGRELGLAFQIKDDLIDATGDAATAGKDLGRDAGAGKATFVTLLGVAGATDALAAQAARAHACLEDFGVEAGVLREVVTFVVERQS